MTAMPPSKFRKMNPTATAEQIYENGREWRKRGLFRLPVAMLKDAKIIRRTVMQFAHEIRKQALWTMESVCWSECIKLAWAEVKAAL